MSSWKARLPTSQTLVQMVPNLTSPTTICNKVETSQNGSRYAQRSTRRDIMLWYVAAGGSGKTSVTYSVSGKW